MKSKLLKLINRFKYQGKGWVVMKNKKFYAIGLVINILAVYLISISTKSMIESIYQVNLSAFFDDFMIKLSMITLISISVIIWGVILFIRRKDFYYPKANIIKIAGIIYLVIGLSFFSYNGYLLANATRLALEEPSMDAHCYLFPDFDINMDQLERGDVDKIEIFDIIIINELTEQKRFNFLNFKNQSYDASIFDITRVASYENEVTYDYIELRERRIYDTAYLCQPLYFNQHVEVNTVYLIQAMEWSLDGCLLQVSAFKEIPDYDISKPLEEQSQEVLDWLEPYINHENDAS